jgi:hypothetical protein
MLEYIIKKAPVLPEAFYDLFSFPTPGLSGSGTMGISQLSSCEAPL